MATEEEIRKDERQKMASWIRATSSVWAEGERQMLNDLADQIEASDHNRFLEIMETPAPTKRDELVRKHPIIRGGRPCIRDTRFLVSQLIAELACPGRGEDKETLEDICTDHNLDLQAARDALDWVALNMEERLK